LNTLTQKDYFGYKDNTRRRKVGR